MKPKILLVNNFATIRGGADHCVANLKKLLESQGHIVRLFTAEEDVGLLNQHPLESLHYLYNVAAARKIGEIIRDFKPDIAHCHNIYGHLTPSILPVLKKAGIPVIMTLHDWKLICPNHRLFTQGALCERCKGGHFYQSFRNRCFNNSRAASLLGMIESYLHHSLKMYEKHVDLFISPSRFLKNKFVEFGWPPDRIQLLSNFVFFEDNDRVHTSPSGIIYFGEASEIKGGPFLLEALQYVTKPVSVKIMAEGLAFALCQERAGRLPKQTIEFFPLQRGPLLSQKIQSSLAAVFPALWYENQPTAILKVFEQGRAVIGSHRGGIPELVENRKTGLLFEAGHPQALAEQITYLLNHKEEVLAMGLEARKKVERDFDPESHYKKLMGIYGQIQ